MRLVTPPYLHVVKLYFIASDPPQERARAPVEHVKDGMEIYNQRVWIKPETTLKDMRSLLADATLTWWFGEKKFLMTPLRKVECPDGMQFHRTRIKPEKDLFVGLEWSKPPKFEKDIEMWILLSCAKPL